VRLLGIAAVLCAAACGGSDQDAGTPGVATGGAPPTSSPAPAPDPGGGCPAAVTLRVTDARTGGPVPDVSVRGLAMSCREERSATVCKASPPSGSYRLEIGAPGFEDSDVSIAVQSSTSGQGSSCSQTIELGITLSRDGS
jgi:hypothetical protein